MLTTHITDAMKETKLLRITYTDSKNNQTVRTVEPYEVKDGKLFAFCTQKKGIRAFHITNIQSVTKLPQGFEPRFPIVLP